MLTEDVQELDLGSLGNAGEDDDDDNEEEYDEGEGDDDDDDDEDELSEEDEELAAPQTFGGPPTWEAVDLVDLDRVMLRVTAAAMPSTDNKDMGTRLAMQAAALEADNQDLLGLGRIDARHLALVRSDAAKKAWKAGDIGTSKKRAMRRLESRAANAEGRRDTFVTPKNVHKLRHQALPSSENFDPEIYLVAIHGATSLPDLVRGRQNLKNEASERTGQLKALVKENFDRFISCKNTIDDIHKRLRKSEAHDSLSASGNSTADMVIAISEVQDEAKRAFASLLERASTSDQVKSVVALLKRYEGLFQLPSRIRQSTERSDFDQVISEYKKARSLMDSMGAPNTKSVWHKLFTEVEKVVTEVVKLLESQLKDPETPQLAALDAMRHALQLQAERASATRGMEPVNLYVRARERHLRMQIEDCTDRHKFRLQNVREQQPNLSSGRRASLEAPAKESDNARPHAIPESPWHLGNESASWVTFVKELVQTVIQSLPDFWHVPQDKLSQLKAIPGALKVVQEAVDDALVMAQALLRSFSNKLSIAFKELAQEEHDKSFFLSALREMISAFVHFKATSTPPFVSECLQELLEVASASVIDQMAARLKRLTAKMADLEDFEVIALSHKAGHPASKLPGMLKEVISNSMEQLSSVMEEGCRADSTNYAFNPIGKQASNLRHTFFDCFTNYAVATDQLWAAVSSTAGSSSRRGLSRDAKLLVLHSNCVHVRTQVLKDLSTRYDGLLTTDGGLRESEELQSECAEDILAVEGRLAGIYIEARVDLINDMLDEYFEDDGTDWNRTPLPTGLRDCAFEIINALVAVQAEVYGNALSLQRRVMDELLQHLFSAYVTCLSEKLKELNAGGALQLLMEIQYFSKALRPILRPPRDQLLDQAKAAILKRIEQLADGDGSTSEDELEKWCETIQGGDMSGRAEMISGFRAADLIKATRFNVASFQA